MKTRTGKLRKRILAFLLAALLAIYPIANVLPEFDVTVLAEDSLTGDDSAWWTTTENSTAQILSDGGTIAFSVQITSDTLNEGDAAVLCVEATDGTSYFTAASNGACWGAGTGTDATSTGVVVGGSYTVTISRSGNNFTADIVDDSTGSSILDNKMSLTGTSEFGDTGCYIMSQIGDLTVSVISVTDEVVGDTASWWTTTNTSTAISLPDGYSVSWNVTVNANADQAAGTFAAFVVEANDGTSYCSAASNGDIWGAGTDTDDKDDADVSFGYTYAVTLARSGNDFTVTIKGTDADMTMSLAGTSEFGDMTCYIMSQIGDLTVELTSITGPKEETLVGHETTWWETTNTSTAVSLADGATVTWDVTVVANNNQADGVYGAFAVEANDRTYYCTATSDGNIWGGVDLQDPATTATSNGAVMGGTYTVTMSRDGNNFTVDILDADGESILSNEMVLEGSVDFGDTTCYIISQVGNLTVLSYAITEKKEFSTASITFETSSSGTDEDAVSGTTSTTVSIHDPSIVKGYVEDSVTSLSADTIIVGEQDDTYTKGIYFIFGSHLAWAYSWDLVNWTTFTNNINTYYETLFATEAEWAATGDDDYSVDGNMWAPDVIWVSDYDNGDGTKGAWCMYMSINGLSWNSAICMLTSDSLYGSWTYVGSVIYSGFDNTSYTGAGTEDYFAVTGDTEVASRYLRSYSVSYESNTATWWNISYGAHAIDPCVTYDEEGNLWMSYGSWSGGIYMIQLNATTGLRDTSVEYEYVSNTSDPYMGYKIAGGYASSGEGSYIEYYNGYYYLVLSYGGYAQDGGYNMRVYRSTEITGPYVDESGDTASYTSYKNNYATGSSLVSTLGMRWMSNYKWSWQTYAQVAQGHNSVYYDKDTDQIYLVYHTKTNDGTAGHYVNVHQLIQNEDGWLLAAPFTYAEEETKNADITTTTYNADEIAGNYEVIVHALAVDYANLAYVDPVYVVLDADGNISGDLTGTWSETDGTCYFTLVIDGETYHGVLLTETIEGKTTETLTFTAVGTSSEVAIWGYRYSVVETEAENLSLPAQTLNGTSLDLATTGTYGSTIVWTSSNEDVIATDGTVTVPEENTDVTLTAYLTYEGDEPVTKKFTVTVIGSNSIDESGNITVWSSDVTYDLTDAVQGTYSFPNYYNSTIGTAGLELYGGVSISFTAQLTGSATSLSNILGINAGAQGGLYFTGGTYLGYNATGGYFDANLDSTTWTAGINYLSTADTEVAIEIRIYSYTYEVYVDGTKVYDMDTVEAGTTAGSNSIENMYYVLNYLNSTATELDLGWGSWWDGGFAGTISDLTLTAFAYDGDATGDDVDGYLYKETYATLPGTSGTETGWVSTNAQSALSVVTDDYDEMDWYLDYTDDSASGNRGAYLNFNDGAALATGTYTVSADIAITPGKNSSAINQFAILGTDYAYSSSNINYGISSGYILLLSSSGASSTMYYINGSTTDYVTIPSGTWVRVTAYVNTKDGTAYVTIVNRSDSTDILWEGTVSISGSGSLKGLYLLRGRTSGEAKVDNIGVSYSVGSLAADGTVNTLDWWDYTNFFGVTAEEDFTVSWKFMNYSNESSNYQNYAIAVVNDDTRTYELGDGDDWYLRADYWSNATFSDETSTSTVAYTSDWDWNDFIAMMNGAEIDATLTRDGDTMTFTAVICGSDGNTYTYTATAESADTTENMAIYLGGQDCYLVIEEYSVTDDICHYDAVVTEPTCTEDGYTTYTCIYCNDSYVADATEATGHNYVESVGDEYTTWTCSGCGDSYETVTVAVWSMSSSSDTADSVANLTGGGTYDRYESVTVTATGNYGYTFLGWYEAVISDSDGSVSYDSNSLVSEESSYTFTADANASLVAVYKPNSTWTLTIYASYLNSADSEYFTVSDGTGNEGTYSVDYTNTYTSNVTITLTASGDNFLYWKNGSDKVVSRNATYEFTIVSDTELYPVYDSTTSDQSDQFVIVEYMTWYNQVLTRESYKAGSTVTEPDVAPSRLGWTFQSWGMTTEEVEKLIEGGETTYICVTPSYVQSDTTYRAYVYVEDELKKTYDGDNGEGYAAGETLTVEAPAAAEGEYFQYWENADGEILSYTSSYMVYLSQNITLYAVYGEEAVSAEPVVSMTNTYAVEETDGNYKIAFEATRSVPDGYTVLETGILVSTGVTTPAVGDSNVTKFASSSTDADGVFTLYVQPKSISSTLVYARAYVIVQDSNGNISTYYSDVTATTYANLM
ncbi:MAG: glycoside hydrolase family 43 protein [Lachnospiraceae bacterium]|nr:glycoside hydrolase family 43 protein [Lachnospiraceae bacterium]